MAKIRLNQGMRQELQKYAEGLIAFPEDETHLDRLRRTAAGLICHAMAKRAPYSDILVLAKYDKAREIDDKNSIRIVLDNYHQKYFVFGSEAPFWICDRWGSPEPLQVDQPTFDAVDAWADAKDALAKKKHDLLLDYYNLIAAAYSFEELCEVWPEAEVMRDSIEGRAGKRAISCLSADALERIKKDIASRRQA